MPPPLPRKTPTVARELGIPVTRLNSLLRTGKIVPLPCKDTSGGYIWADSDVERARQAVAAADAKRRKKVPA